MQDLIRVEYGQTGQSTQLDGMGMREMQARAFERREQQYLLIKAPPASGKSRALMFLALDKLLHQGLRKAIVAVPEMAIGRSFRDADLATHGFYADWRVLPEHDLCDAGGSDGNAGKIEAFRRFLADEREALEARTLVCTHATLRYAYKQLSPADFNDTVLAIDEFHHVAADEANQLGNVLDELMRHSSAHIVAMTGSYFRGDTVPILLPEDEAHFDKVTYTYYEQLNGYKHLKSLGIGYHFYQGRYLDAIGEVLDPAKKTLIHIPHVHSGESTKDKHAEVDAIIDALGEVELPTEAEPLYRVRTPDGRLLRVADLVDDSSRRAGVMRYLRNVEDRDDVDIIVALGMAKEGFDWIWCEHVLTVGYRSSMTEVVQIIGRATRDAPGKHHAQFTNLIAQPDANDADVRDAVNNMLKAITVSLLMEQVMAPSFNFRPRRRQDEPGAPQPGEIEIGNADEQPSERTLEVLNKGADEITEALLSRPRVQRSYLDDGMDAEVINHTELPKVIAEKHPELDETEREHVRQGVLQKLFWSSAEVVNKDELPEDASIAPPPDPETAQRVTGAGYDDEPGGESGATPQTGEQFLRMGNRFYRVEDLNIDLIEQVNPFRGAYEILSKSVDASVLRTIQEEVQRDRIQMSEEEAKVLWPKIKRFVDEHGREPSLHATDPLEARYAECLTYLRRLKRQQMAGASS